MDSKRISLVLGLGVVVGTHVAMLGDFLPMNTLAEKQAHAGANLVAAAMIIYGTIPA